MATAGTLTAAAAGCSTSSAPAPDLAAARAAAYRAAGQIRMRGGWYRTDIAAAAGTWHSAAGR